jgi:hypothetical protein
MNKYVGSLWFTVPVGLSTSLCGVAAQADTWTPMPLAPEYKVEAVRFHSNHETWHDWLGADDVRVGIGTPTTETISKVFSNVDAGETKTFAPDQSCIYPIDGRGPGGNGVFKPSQTWTCSNRGASGPISFTVVMAEEDGGFFHDCLSDFPTGGCAFYSPSRLPDPNDELIGWYTVEFTPEQLAFAMPNVGDYIEPVIMLGPCHDERKDAGHCGRPPEPVEYTFTYRITRVAPAPLFSSHGADRRADGIEALGEPALDKSARTSSPQ